MRKRIGTCRESAEVPKNGGLYINATGKRAGHSKSTTMRTNADAVVGSGYRSKRFGDRPRSAKTRPERTTLRVVSHQWPSEMGRMQVTQGGMGFPTGGDPTRRCRQTSSIQFTFECIGRTTAARALYFALSRPNCVPALRYIHRESPCGFRCAKRVHPAHPKNRSWLAPSRNSAHDCLR